VALWHLGFTGLAVMTLILGGTRFAVAQEASNANLMTDDSDQWSGASIPNQTPRPPAQTPQPPATRTAARRTLNCRYAADPNKRRFGCKDETFGREETLTRDWNGVRDEARVLGITPTASYYSALQTNATGGSHQVWAYVGQLTTGVDFDFEKLLTIPGMSVYLSEYWGTGSSLTATIDSVFPVSINFGVGFHLGEIYLHQKLLNGDLTLAAGRLAANFTFAGLPVFDNYMTAGINGTPFSLLKNDVSFSGPPPGLEWGAQAVYSPAPVVQIAAGVFNTNPNSANNGNVFSFQQGNKGALVTAQITYLHRQRSDDGGKPGQYTAGFFEDTNDFAVLPAGRSRSNGNAGIFVVGQQMVYQPEEAGLTQGLTAWGALAYSGKQSVSPMPVFGGAGLSYEGLIRQRKNDVVSVGWLYGKTSDLIPSASAATLLEVNYQFVSTRYLRIFPDFQYLWRPTGTNSSAAAVFGVRLNLTF
jgi:porin